MKRHDHHEEAENLLYRHPSHAMIHARCSPMSRCIRQDDSRDCSSIRGDRRSGGPARCPQRHGGHLGVQSQVRAWVSCVVNLLSQIFKGEVHYRTSFILREGSVRSAACFALSQSEKDYHLPCLREEHREYLPHSTYSLIERPPVHFAGR